MLSSASEQAKNVTELPKKEKPRVPAAEILPSDRFPFPVHLDILKRFSTLSHNGTQALDATRVEGEGVPGQSAALNVRFLKSIGLLTSADRGQYMPTPETIRFVTARSVNDQRARPILAALLEPTWIVTTARNILSPTRATKEDVLLGELAIAAQTDKGKKEPALRVLIEYLLFSGIIRREENGLVIATSPPEGGAGASSHATFQPGAEDRPTILSAGYASEQVAKGWHVIQTEDFFLRIRSSVEALDDLSEHLKTVRRKVERLKDKQEDATQNAQPST
jgi:hypothetical protein